MSEWVNQCVIVGIAGASVSGKSLIASTIYNELREKVGDHQIVLIRKSQVGHSDQSNLIKSVLKLTTIYPNALIMIYYVNTYSS